MLSEQPSCVYLLESDVLGVLPEALTAHVEAVLPDHTVPVGARPAAGKHHRTIRGRESDSCRCTVQDCNHNRQGSCVHPERVVYKHKTHNNIEPKQEQKLQFQNVKMVLRRQYILFVDSSLGLACRFRDMCIGVIRAYGRSADEEMWNKEASHVGGQQGP